MCFNGTKGLNAQPQTEIGEDEKEEQQKRFKKSLQIFRTTPANVLFTQQHRGQDTNARTPKRTHARTYWTTEHTPVDRSTWNIVRHTRICKNRQGGPMKETRHASLSALICLLRLWRLSPLHAELRTNGQHQDLGQTGYLSHRCPKRADQETDPLLRGGASVPLFRSSVAYSGVSTPSRAHHRCRQKASI